MTDRQLQYKTEKSQNEAEENTAAPEKGPCSSCFSFSHTHTHSLSGTRTVLDETNPPCTYCTVGDRVGTRNLFRPQEPRVEIKLAHTRIVHNPFAEPLIGLLIALLRLVDPAVGV